MKTFLFIFIFALSLKAESSLQSRCVDSFYFTYGYPTPLNKVYVYFSDLPTTATLVTYSYSVVNELVTNDNKFKYDSTTQRCNPILKNNTLGMTNEQYNFMMALTGLLTSILLVFIIFLKV